MSDSGKRLADKVAIVTGSSSGLGRAIAMHLALEGCKFIVCADLREEARPEIAEESKETTHAWICNKYGADRAVFHKTDVTAEDEVEACVTKAESLGGRLHIFINNAGRVPPIGRLHETSSETLEQVLAVNVRGMFHGCKFACAQFLAQDLDADGCRGRIVNIASVAGLVAFPHASAYNTSKGAVVQLTKSVAVDYGQDAINCNAVCPGYLKTAMTRPFFETPGAMQRMQAMTPMWNSGNIKGTEAVARAVAYLASADATWVTGSCVPIDGGLTSI